MNSTSILAAGRQHTTAATVKRFSFEPVCMYPSTTRPTTTINSPRAQIRYFTFWAFRYPGCPFSILMFFYS